MSARRRRRTAPRVDEPDEPVHERVRYVGGPRAALLAALVTRYSSSKPTADPTEEET